MATEAETPEDISVMKIKGEIKEFDCSHFDATVSKASLGELQKIEDEHRSSPDTVGNSTETEVLEVATDAKDTENHVLESKVRNSEGESFLKSPSVSNIASEEICGAFDVCEEKEKSILVEKDAENAMQLGEQNSTSTSMENERVEEETANSASEMESVEECITKKFPSIPIISPFIDQNAQEEKIEGGEDEVMEEKKQKSEEVSDDKMTLIEEAQKDEILHHQLVENSKAVHDEQMLEAICATQSVKEEEVATDSKKDEIEGKMSGEDLLFESGEQVGQTIQAIPDHNQEAESLNNDDKSAGGIENMVSIDKNMELLACSNGENGDKNSDSQKIPIKKEVGKTNSEEVVESKEQDKPSNLLGTEEIENEKKAGDENPQANLRGVLEDEETTSHELDIPSVTTATEEARSLKAEPEESGTPENVPSLSLEDKKEAEKAKEKMSKGTETADSNVYIDKKIIQEDEAINDQSEVSFVEETVQSSQEEEKVEEKHETEVSEGREVDEASKDSVEQIIEERDVVKDHCTVSTVEETVKQSNQEDEKEAKEFEKEVQTKTTIANEDIQKTASVKDHCTVPVGEETVGESSQEDEEAKNPEVEVFEGLETNGTSEDTAKQIIEDGVVTYLSTASIDEETIKKSSHEDEVHETKQIIEDTQDSVVTHLSTASMGEETIKESSQEDEVHERIKGAEDCEVTENQITEEDLATTDLPTIRSSQEDEVSKELETIGASEAAVKAVEEHVVVTDISAVAIGEVATTEEYTQKPASEDNNVVKDQCTASVGEETVKASCQEDEEAKKPEVDGMVTEEQIVKEEIAAKDLPTISLGEETVKRSSQEDEVCKELETTGPSEDAVKESVEEHGAVADICAVAIGEVTTIENSHEEEKEAITQGEVKDSDQIAKELDFRTTDCTRNIETVTFKNEEDPNKSPTITEASGKEIQEELNEKLAGSSVESEVSEEHIEGEISEKEKISNDKLETENEKISLNDSEPEGAKLTDSDLPSEEMSPVPIEANGTSLKALHDEDVKLEENPNLDENALKTENTEADGAKDETKYNMTLGTCAVPVPESDDHGTEITSGTEMTGVMAPQNYESEKLLETSTLPSRQQDPELVEENEKIKDEILMEDKLQDEKQETPIVAQTTEESFTQKEETYKLEETSNVKSENMGKENAYEELQKEEGEKMEKPPESKDLSTFLEEIGDTSSLAMQEKKLETIDPEEKITEEYTVKDEIQETNKMGYSGIVKAGDDEVLEKSSQKDDLEMDKQERCIDLVSEQLEIVDSSANDGKNTSDKGEEPVKNLEESFKEERTGGELSEIDHTRETEFQKEVENFTDLASIHENLKPADACKKIQSTEMDDPYKHEDDSSIPNLKPREEINKEDGPEEAQVIEATEDSKSTEIATVDHEKTDGLAASRLIQPIEMECVNLEAIDPAEKFRGASESVAENQSYVTFMETEKEGKTIKDQNTEFNEDYIIGQSTQEEEMESKKLEETVSKVKPEEQNHEVYYTNETTKNCIPSEKVPQEVERADESEEIEKQITEEEVAAKELYTVSVRDEAVKEVTDSDLVPSERNIEVTNSNDNREIVAITDEENCNSRADIAGITKAAGEEILKKDDCEKLLELSTLTSEVHEENNKETDDTSGMLKTESVIVATEETSSQEVEPEVEKIVLPSGIGFEEKSPERVETTEISLMDDEDKSAKLEEKSESVSQPPTTEDGNQNQERLIVEKLDAKKSEEEFKDELVAASDAVSQSEDQREETIIESDDAADRSQTAEKPEEKIQESSAFVSETQELEISATEKIKDNPTIEDASEIMKNPEIETMVDQNVEGDAQELQVPVATREIAEVQMEDGTQDQKNADALSITKTAEATCPHKEEECKEPKVSDMGSEDVEETQNAEPMKKAENPEIAPNIVPFENVSESKDVASILEKKETTEPRENSEKENLKDDKTLETGEWKEESESKGLEKCFSGAHEETETSGESANPVKDVLDNDVQVKNHDESSNNKGDELTSSCDTAENDNPNEENSKAVNLSEKIETGEVKSPNKNEDNSHIVLSSVEETLVGEVGGECDEVSNLESEELKKALESVSETQIRGMLPETKQTENDEDGAGTEDHNTVAIGDEGAGKSFEEDKMGGENLKEGRQLETGENQSEKSEANEYPGNEIANEETSGKLEKGCANEYIEKQITKEEVSVHPYQVSVQKSVKDKEDEEKGEKLEDEVQVEPEEHRHDLEAGEIQSEKTYEANETMNKEISNEEIQVRAGLENIGTSESSEKQITGEEGSVEEPYLISVGEETVKEKHQEDHKGEQFKEAATKTGPGEPSNELETEEDQNANTNEATDTTQNEIVNEEIRGLENAGASETNEKLITEEEEVAKNPYEKWENKIKEAATKLDLEDQNHEAPCRDHATENEEGLENVGASETNEKLIIEEEEAAKNPYEKWENKIKEAAIKLDLEDQNHEALCRDHTTETEEIVLAETNSETTISTETREIVIVKDKEGPNKNLHDPPASNAPYKETPIEETPIEETGGMVVELSALVPEETIPTNSETMTSATEDARAPECLLEVDNLKNSSSELASKPIVITEDLPLKDEGVPTNVNASVLIEASVKEIPEKEDKATEDEVSYIVKQAIAEVGPLTEGSEGQHMKDEAPGEEILKKEAEKKLDKANIQEKVCEHEDKNTQIPKQEEKQVFLAVEQATAERSIMASTDKISNNSDLVVEEQCQLKTELKYEAQVHESENTEATKLEDVDSLNEKLGDLSNIQPSAKEILDKEAALKLAEGNEIPQSVEKIEKSTDTTNEEQVPREVNFNESTETNISTGSTDTPSVPKDQSGRILEKTNIEDQKPGEISEIEPELKGAECEQNEESIDEPKPTNSDKVSLSDLLHRSKKETSVEDRVSLANKELSESKVPPAIQVEEEAKEEKEKDEKDEEDDEHKKEDSGSDAPVMVEASTEVDVKPTPKKSHNILSGVGKVSPAIQVEEEAKEEKEKDEEDEEEDDDEHKKADSGSDAPVMVEASTDVDVKPTPKKSHSILSGVGSKVKHSIAKVKKAITGKSSQHKSTSPKQESE